jgi:uncharacterized protein with HEPN domain
MHIVQILKLSAHLTDEFKLNFSEIPWKQIKAMRNFVAHNYAKLDLKYLWSTIKNDVPNLYNFCKKTTEMYDNDEQSIIRQPAPSLKPR